MTEEITQPGVSIDAQYIKDLSFENPSAPSSLGETKAPQISLNLDINISPISDADGSFEVALEITATTKRGENVMFIIELVYAGVFTLTGIPKEEYNAVLSVTCPAMLFPFARQIISYTTQAAGYQALMIDPINFGASYMKKLQEQEEQEGEDNMDKKYS